MMLLLLLLFGGQEGGGLRRTGIARCERRKGRPLWLAGWL
jgi:hypothetical protein